MTVSHFRYRIAEVISPGTRPDPIPADHEGQSAKKIVLAQPCTQFIMEPVQASCTVWTSFLWAAVG